MNRNAPFFFYGFLNQVVLNYPGCFGSWRHLVVWYGDEGLRGLAESYVKLTILRVRWIWDLSAPARLGFYLANATLLYKLGHGFRNRMIRPVFCNSDDRVLGAGRNRNDLFGVLKIMRYMKDIEKNWNAIETVSLRDYLPIGFSKIMCFLCWTAASTT